MSGRNAGSMLLDAEQEAGRPLRAMIEIADRCNEVCVHCYQEQGLKGEMTTEQLESVIDQLAELGVLILTISGGEATLRKDFLRIMKHARARGFVLRLFTNGLTMTRELARELHRLAVDVVEISLYSHRAEVHDFVTGVPGSFAKTVAGIGHLVEVGVHTHVKSPVMSVNEDAIDAYLDFVESLGVTYALDPQVLSPREHSSLDPAALDRTVAGLAALVRNPRVGESRQVVQTPTERRRPCGAGESIHIEPDGSIRPCVVLPMEMGHALEGGGVADSQASTVRAQLAELTWAHVHGCRECDLQSHCGRCHAQALAEAGDALGPYPSACAAAAERYRYVHDGALTTEGATGPYRVEGAVARAFEDRVTLEDDARASRLGWVRRAAAPAVAASIARPGVLVQLRRPGLKRARPERVPGEGGAVDAAE
ncbi:MAG: radical SAM protein [Myxococcales bacterium]|nr:radical SAM protein [Myxococcales bacterium]